MKKDHQPNYKRTERLLRPVGLNDGSPLMTALYNDIDNMGTSVAVAKFFREANLNIKIEGDTSAWNKTGKGALLIGSHANGFERFPMLAVFGDMQREDVRFIAMPFTPAAIIGREHDAKRLTQALQSHYLQSFMRE